MNKSNFEEDWNSIPKRGILPQKVQARMWSNIAKKTIYDTNFYIRKIAAACILLLAGAATYYAVFEVEGFVENQLVYKQTYAGVVEFVRLPDGSRVWINENSKLGFPKAFDENNRTVTLEGEAYFDVKEAKGKPFIIKSSQMTTTTNQSSFQLSLYNKKHPKVWVDKGRVKVKNEILKSGDIVTYKLDVDHLLKENTVFKAPKWKQSIIDVEGYTLSETIERLKKDYNFNVLYNSESIKDIKLRGTLIKQPLDSMLITLSYALKLKISPTGSNKTYNITTAKTKSNN